MVVFGAGGHAKVVIDILESNGIKIDYLVDDNPRIKELCGYKVRRDVRRYDEVIVAIGSSESRKEVVRRLSVRKYASAVDPSATVSDRASIGDGSVVMQGAVVQSGAHLGKHCIVNTCASVDHDCEVGDFVHIAPHAAVLGGVKLLLQVLDFLHHRFDDRQRAESGAEPVGLLRPRHAPAIFGILWPVL